MHVSLAENSAYSTDAMQAYFSDTLVSGIQDYLPLPFIPQITNSNGQLTNTIGWTLVSGNFTATGGENYLIIGNFKNDANTVTQPSASGSWQEAYYYIDEVSLTTCTGIENPDENAAISIYPNPVTNELHVVTGSNTPSEIILYDAVSGTLLQQSFMNSISINTEPLAKVFIFMK
jgi:hypothetical protein